jgi:PleD family two-component response regulator
MRPDYPLRFSGGAVAILRAANSFGEAVLMADQLLYAPKQAGRKRVYYTDQIEWRSGHAPNP